MNKLFFPVCLFLFVHTSSVSGQTMMGPYWLYDNQYLTNKYILNPAFAGKQNDPKVFAGTQRMELQLKDAPSVHLAGAYGRLGAGRKHANPYRSDALMARNAVGGLLFADNNGPFQAIGIKLDYVYTIPLNKKSTTLSFGLGGMLFSKRLRLDKYLNEAPDDPLIAASVGNHVMVPDFNAGALLSHRQWYVGISASQLLENSYSFSKFNYTPARVYRNFYLLTGYRFIRDGFELEPSIAAGRNTAPETRSNNGNFIDVNVEFFLKPIVFTVSYRIDGYIATALLYRERKLELGIRAELFPTNKSDAHFSGVGLTASYTFLKN